MDIQKKTSLEYHSNIDVRIVLDTNTLISATQWSNSIASRLVNELMRKSYIIVVSPEILREYSHTLSKLFDFTYIDLFVLYEEKLPFTRILLPKDKVAVVRDLDDNKILECAIECGAKYVITQDADLLLLKKYGRIQIITPVVARAML